MSDNLYKQRAERERAARKAAEELLEAKSSELFATNKQLKESAAALLTKTSEMNVVLDRTVAGILMVDGERNIQIANPAACIMFGADAPADLIGKPVADLFKAEQADEVAAIEAAAGDGKDALKDQSTREFEAARLDGGTLPVEVAVAATELNDERRTVWICRDLTRRKQAEAERAELERELRHAQKLDSLGTLASGIAHEINTPVQYVSDNVRFLNETFDDLLDLIKQYRGLVTACADGAPSADIVQSVRDKEDECDLDFLFEETPGAIEQTLNGLQQISKIVTAIKEFSHPGTTEKTAVDLNEAIETTLTVSRNQWKYIAEAETDLAAGMPPVMCHPSDFNQVILNLIVNAAHAIEAHLPDGELGRIKVSTRLENGQVRIDIADNGGGIPAEHAERIFDPFFTTKGVGKGTGQGLAIAHNFIVNKHGGDLRFDTEVGKGTTFTILLPVGAKDSEQEAAA